MSKEETLKQLFKDNGLEKEDVFKAPQGFVIITRSGIEKIQYKNNIKVNFEAQVLTPEFVVVKAIGKKGESIIETYGEASPKNCRNPYIVSMAEKRALSRVVLKLSGLYEHGIFGEDESEDFKK